jgi:carbamoyl-phosphate synthase small subunit
LTGPRQVGAYVLLEDGTRFDGEAVGADHHATGEVVFNTAMTGYQEAVTDPSYAGQIITFTYPLVGNYGVADEHIESDRVHTRAVVMREARNDSGFSLAGKTGNTEGSGRWLDWLTDNGIPAISGVDTRALVRHIRDQGAMKGGVFGAETTEREALELIEAEPSMLGQDLTGAVTPAGPLSFDEGSSGPRVVAIDTGVKASIVRNLRERDCRLTLLPCTSSSAEVLERDPHAVFLANGPGDPAALDQIVATVRELVGKVPVFGICLGHQLLCRAVGLETFKLPFGHRGANHPVKDLATGKIEITAQNHGFAVVSPGGERHVAGDESVRWETDFGAASLSHVNLYDRTVEGLLLHDVPAACVQYHPEAGPGPHDSLYLFDRFLELARR